MTTLVEVGSVVKYVEWEAVPDKYAAPRLFSDPADAAKYADETAGRVSCVVTFPEGVLRVGPEVAAGDVVLRVQYCLQRWTTADIRTEYDSLAEATAAVPPGRTVGVYQLLWIGPPGTEGVRAYGDTIKVTGGEAR